MNNKLPDTNMLKRLLEEGMNVADIALRYGTHKETVRTGLKRLGLSHLVQAQTPVHHALDRESIARDIRAGLSWNRIDIKYGVSPGTAKRFAVHHEMLDLAPSGTVIHDDKIVVGKHFFTWKEGQPTYMAISLPRNSMHLAALQGRP